MQKKNSSKKLTLSKKEIFRKIIEEAKKINLKTNYSRKKFSKLKRDILRKSNYKGKIPSNAEIAHYATEHELVLLADLFSIKKTRTASGVSVVAVMTKPYPCPHGKCSYCAGGVDSSFGSVPQSYTGAEPATRRAIRNDYDPYLQVMNRLEQYVVIGKNPQKIELILMGGTFPSFPKIYQKNFVYYCFKAMNDFSKEFYRKGKFNLEKFREIFLLPGDKDDENRLKKVKKNLLKLKLKNKITNIDEGLKREQKKNEKNNIRCVGLTVETRSDVVDLKTANFLLSLGTTRIELGIQSVYDDVLASVNRGHDTKENIRAISLLKDLGFKLNFHMMPGLPDKTKKRISKERDVNSLLEIFRNPDYRPDMLKIYPAMVMPGTEMYDWYKKGLFKPLTTKEASEIIIELKKQIPEYCRIMRVQRDIPTKNTIAGVNITNLRQYIAVQMKKEGLTCNCIRCREPRDRIVSSSYKIKIIEYDASGGKEFFISAIDSNNYILGFCRLRFPKRSLRKEITKKSALIRELHVYGLSMSFGNKGKVQHRGIGSKLLRKAEEIAKNNSYNKMVIISGIGVREYYRRKHGYKKQGPYMVKKLV